MRKWVFQDWATTSWNKLLILFLALHLCFFLFSSLSLCLWVFSQPFSGLFFSDCFSLSLIFYFLFSLRNDKSGFIVCYDFAFFYSPTSGNLGNDIMKLRNCHLFSSFLFIYYYYIFVAPLSIRFHYYYFTTALDCKILKHVYE